jgi:hypothetical protein
VILTDGYATTAEGNGGNEGGIAASGSGAVMRTASPSSCVLTAAYNAVLDRPAAANLYEPIEAIHRIVGVDRDRE